MVLQFNWLKQTTHNCQDIGSSPAWATKIKRFKRYDIGNTMGFDPVILDLNLSC